ncbi:MAG: MFS transporter [Candidatus Rokubacteria bacterium]|nr:MFS transporter [Candidatus Rokubacteria bacterium]
MHFLHDGFSDTLYVLFPLLAGDFRLSLTQVGLLKMAYMGGMAGFQTPAGLLAERWGERDLLAAGTALVATGYFLLGTAGGFGALLGLLLLAGLGSGVQHPLSSSLVSKGYETGPRRVALGTYNFAGDLGKVTVPAVAALVAAWAGWRWATRGYGVLGLLATVVIFVLLGRIVGGRVGGAAGAPAVAPAGRWGILDSRGFSALAAIAVLDTATRYALLTFLPFLLMAKGAPVQSVGLALALVFGGGAVGKFVCGVIAERVGVVRTVVLTELATGAGIFLLLPLPLTPALVLLPFLGIALNGTSSVLYGSVADLVAPERRARAYGLFYTMGVGAAAVAPPLYGLLGDWAGVTFALAVVGVMALGTLPLCPRLRVASIGAPGGVEIHPGA